MSADDSPLVRARRTRLKAWIGARFAGSRKDFVDEAATRGHKLDAAEMTSLQNGHRSFGEKKAAMLETQAAMPQGYLVKALDPYPDGTLQAFPELTPAQAAMQSRSQLQRLDPDVLRIAATTAREIAGRPLDLVQDAEFIAQTYNAVMGLADKPIPTTVVVDLVRWYGERYGPRGVSEAGAAGGKRSGGRRKAAG